MKPRVSYADMQWLQAFARLRTLPAKTKLQAGEQTYELDWVCDEPHPPSVWLRYRVDGAIKHYIVRRGDPLVNDLQAEPTRE